MTIQTLAGRNMNSQHTTLLNSSSILNLDVFILAEKSTHFELQKSFLLGFSIKDEMIH